MTFAVIANAKELVSAWIADRIRDMAHAPHDPRMYEAIGFADERGIFAGALFTDYRMLRDGSFDIQIHVASDPGRITRRIMRLTFDYPFNRLRCSRVSAQAARSNKKSRALLESAGFKMEGVKRGGVCAGRDAILYGLLRNECRWIAR